MFVATCHRQTNKNIWFSNADTFTYIFHPGPSQYEKLIRHFINTFSLPCYCYLQFENASSRVMPRRVVSGTQPRRTMSKQTISHRNTPSSRQTKCRTKEERQGTAVQQIARKKYFFLNTLRFSAVDGAVKSLGQHFHRNIFWCRGRDIAMRCSAAEWPIVMTGSRVDLGRLELGRAGSCPVQFYHQREARKQKEYHRIATLATL